MNSILNRRSIRKYKPEMPSEKMISDILEAGFYAPTAKNLKPWHFVVINDRTILNKITEFHPHSSMLNTAPLAVIVCGDTAISPEMWDQDCAAATENILLRSYELGLGSCWCAVYPREHIMKGFSLLLNLDDNIKPFSMIAIGYPDEERRRPERFKEDRIHYNKFK